jgi:hypothetical protein
MGDILYNEPIDDEEFKDNEESKNLKIDNCKSSQGTYFEKNNEFPEIFFLTHTKEETADDTSFINRFLCLFRPIFSQTWQFTKRYHNTQHVQISKNENRKKPSKT